MKYETKYGTLEILLKENDLFEVKCDVPFMEYSKNYSSLASAKKEYSELKEELDALIEKMEAKKEKTISEELPIYKTVRNALSLSGAKRILLYGPTGTGKTRTLYELAKQMKNKGEINDFLLFVCSTGMEDLDFLGKFVPKSGGELVFEESIFTKYVKRAKTEKILIILDEFNRAKAKALNILIPLLDAKDGVVRLNNFINGEIIEVPEENIMFFLTANFGGGYAGTNIIDAALLNRIDVALFVDYQAELEEKLVEDLSNEKAQFLKELVKFLRKMYQSGLIEPFSTRDLITAKQIIDKVNIEDKKKVYQHLLPILYKLVKYDQLGYPDEEVLTDIEKFIKEGKYDE